MSSGLSVTLATPPVVSAQAPTSAAASGRLNVSLECDASCVPAEYRSRVEWVNWVESANDADVRVRITSEPDPDGGAEYRVDFVSSEGLAAGDDQIVFRSVSADTDAETRDGIATILNIGVARYATIAGFREFVALRTPEAARVDPNARVVSAQEVDDPWNLWVFSVGGNTNISGTETRNTRRTRANFSANRTTPTWNLSFSGRANFNIQEIERSDGSIFKSDERDWTINTGITYALADHWSLNVSSLTARLPRFNQTLRADLTPGVEYSLFPYEEATRRAITLRYTVAVTHRRYEELTIYNQIEETPWEQALELRGSMRQPWGDASLTATGSHILGDFDKHNASLRGSVSFRLVRGLRFNAGGDISWVKDQVYLSAAGVTDEEALLRLRTQGSAFNKGLNFGFSYQFGSIFNNTVNNRFPGAGGGGGGEGGGGGGGGGGQP
jgi:hypothetical protein